MKLILEKTHGTKSIPSLSKYPVITPTDNRKRLFPNPIDLYDIEIPDILPSEQSRHSQSNHQ